MPDPITAPNPEPTPGAPPVVPPAKSELQDRIDTIYGQKKEAEENLALAAKENEELRARLLAAEEKVALQTRIASSSQSSSGVPTSTTPGAPVPTDALSDIRQQLAQLNEVMSRKKLEGEQVQSLHKARQFIPGLAAGDQDLVKAATDILARDPVLQKHPQGPMLAAALAASLRSSTTPNLSPQPGLTTPTPTAMTGLEATNAAKQIAALEAEVATIKGKMALSGGSEHWAKYKNLMVKLGELKKQSK